MNINYLFIMLFSLLQCSNQRTFSDIPNVVTDSYYQSNNKKVDFCEFLNNKQNSYCIKTNVCKETPLYMIDSVLNYFMVECHCNNFVISLNGRQGWPINEVLSGDKVITDCNNSEDAIVIVDIPDEIIEKMCRKFIDEINSAKTIITIDNGLVYFNGDTVASNLDEPIKICFNRENTFQDLMNVYSILLNYYKVNSTKELFKRIRICNYFATDDLFYKKATIRLNK